MSNVFAIGHCGKLGEFLRLNYQEQFKKYGMMKIIGNRPFIQRYDIAKMIYQIYYDPSFVPTSEGFVTQYK